MLIYCLLLFIQLRMKYTQIGPWQNSTITWGIARASLPCLRIVLRLGTRSRDITIGTAMRIYTSSVSLDSLRASFILNGAHCLLSWNTREVWSAGDIALWRCSTATANNLRSSSWTIGCRHWRISCLKTHILILCWCLIEKTIWLFYLSFLLS